MASAALSAPRTKSLKDAELKERLQTLRQTDNFTNLYYLIRTWLYFAVVIGGTIAFYYAGFAFWWNIPVTILAIILIGGGQHQLSGLAHEGVHHILFRNRWFNDLASDLGCMFPIYSSTHHYRLQHLALTSPVKSAIPQRDLETARRLQSRRPLAAVSDGQESIPADAAEAALAPQPVPLHPHPRCLQRDRDRQEPLHAQGLEAVESCRACRHPVHAHANRAPGNVRLSRRSPAARRCAWSLFAGLLLFYWLLPDSKNTIKAAFIP